MRTISRECVQGITGNEIDNSGESRVGDLNHNMTEDKFRIVNFERPTFYSTCWILTMTYVPKKLNKFMTTPMFSFCPFITYVWIQLIGAQGPL